MKTLRKCLLLAALGTSAALTAGSASAAPPKKPAPKPVDLDKVEVTVVEVAGTHAYVKPGSKAGVRRGSHVFLGNREFIVGNSTTHYAIIDLGDDPPREGEKGEATVIEEAAQPDAPKLPKPRPDSAFDGQWPTEEAPASGKAVKFVPLGGEEAAGKNDVRITALMGGTLPIGQRGGTFAHAELNARVHAEPFTVPLAFILDASVQNWFGPGVGDREGSSARPIIRAREILLQYGTTNDAFQGQLGRMRYAAATLDTLDGVRVRTNLGGGFSLAGFGGLLPDPNNGDPSTAAQRFGVEAGYSNPESSLRPEAALVANGSVFKGTLDERRIGGVFGIFPDHSRVGAHFEVGNYAAGNPFKAAAVELNNAGVDGALIFGNVQIGARIDMRKPDRSLWLASYLPHDFFCLLATTTAPGATQPICDGRTETRLEGSLDATLSLDNIIVAGGATTARDIEIGGLPSMYGGYLSGRVLHIAQMFRADVGAAYTQSTYLNMLSANAGPGVSLLNDSLDLGAYYRFASVSYFAGGDARLENGVGVTGMYIPSRALAFTLQAEAIKGSDVDALVTLLTAMYRPPL